MLEFPTPTLPSIPEVYAHACNKSTVTDYCRIAQVILSLPLLQGIDADFDLGIKQGGNGQSDGPRTRSILYTDNTLWH